MSDFVMSPEQRGEISVDDLARLILKVLQYNRAAKAKGQFLPYGEGALGNIEWYEFCGGSRLAPPEEGFHLKFAEAKQKLYSEGFIVPDPTQRSDEYCVLTTRGRAADTKQPIIGVTDASGFVGAIEEDAGTLDPVVRSYVEEA